MSSRASSCNSDGKAFDRLHRSVQKFVWESSWEELRPIQVQAIEVIFGTTDDLVVSAPTASGKTEAAFMPILSEVADEPEGSVRVLYVGPLKALINDQFRRLEDELCRHAGIPVHRWHGDVSGSRKQRLVEHPGGVLLITPESIESLFVNRTRELERLFAGTEYVVVDEMHAFMGTERGAHLRSLLSRIDRRAGGRVRRVGLSATLGPEIEQPKRWLSGESGDGVRVVEQEGGGELQVVVHGYEQVPADVESPEPVDEQELDDLHDVAGDIFRTMRGQTNLVFGNSKAELEVYVDRLGHLCEERRVPGEFFIHHGSLDRSIRQATEARMQGEEPATTFCTNTLELGIDVGLIDTVGQLDPPWRVSSLAQRVGRSGRHEGEPSRLRFFVRQKAAAAARGLVERLRPRLVQSVAMVELFALERWCEPFRPRRHHSTLVQQILSILKATGGLGAGELYERLVADGPFEGIEPSEFAELLRRLGREGLVGQTPGTGNLILDVGGERIVDHFRFYAAFRTPERFDVRHGADRIGEVDPGGLERGDHLLLAGRRWAVERLDRSRHEVVVSPASGKREPMFRSGGMRDVHGRVRREMRRVLASEEQPVFVDETARRLLGEARRMADEARLDERRLVERGADTLLFPWRGDRVVRTLVAMAAAEQMEVEVERFHIGVRFVGIGRRETRAFLRDVASGAHRPLDLAGSLDRRQKAVQKYDEYLPDSLLDRVYTHNYLDVQGAREVAREIVGEGADGGEASLQGQAADRCER